ncbi:lipocalin-like domain-containing protein [Dyella sp. C9]|uniref:lipocalin-like domain-containing protein n=1 Tax=Dyella sp. C9 TaxID=2202154 RepID=UPI001E5A65C8|nr:lipocalin-like domain-containing protein [Dyella sp. C9]
MALLLSACAFWAAAAGADSAQDISSLAGSWTLVAADVQHPDGSRAPDFGAQPKGLLLVDRQGHYSLQIYKSERPAFHSGDKAKGTPEEYEAAVMGSSTHFGTLSIEQGHGVLVFHIQGASFPNWEGQDQRRQYQLNDNTLSYRVAPRPNGDVPISVWKRID